ncbi:unnamed protein product, partial [Prorocentrum cordatum]
ALSGRRARHRYGHNTCSSAKGWPCKSTNVLPCIITSAWGNQEVLERRRRRRRKPEGEHRTIVRMTRVASSRGRDRRAAAARKSGARPRRRGGAHGGCERAASAPVRESAGGPVGRAGRRSEEHVGRESEEKQERTKRNMIRYFSEPFAC